jgi:hypothetical protein
MVAWLTHCDYARLLWNPSQQLLEGPCKGLVADIEDEERRDTRDGVHFAV